MRKVLIFAGTTEGRQLAEELADMGVECVACVATVYGEQVIPEREGLTVHTGRMDAAQMQRFLSEDSWLAVVDATHPFAAEVSENIKLCTGRMGLPYLRLQRRTGLDEAKCSPENIIYVKNSEECVTILKNTEGNILLTTGSKELSVYCREETLKDRLIVRVLPGLESIRICDENGLPGRQIIAMQGPFSEELNTALIRQFQIRCLVTKESGMTGGYPEKLAAAEKAGICTVVIRNPEKEPGYSYEEVLAQVKRLAGHTERRTMEIMLAGVGMGSPGSMTQEVADIIAQASYIFGAKRLLAHLPAKKQGIPCYMAKDIIPHLEKILAETQNQPANGNKIKVAILFSGDSGFYSGCQAMYGELQKWKEINQNDIRISISPGISSISYLAAKTGVSWHDAKIISLHGRKAPGWKKQVAEAAAYYEKTFLLLSGVEELRELGKLLNESGLESCQIIAGYQLSYPEEQIVQMKPDACEKLQQEGLYTCLILNPDRQPGPLTHGMQDTCFIRGRVPMTKEEVREVSICKLRLYDGAVVYDIGSGTGSVAVEMGRLPGKIQVFAIEKKEEACALIQENCQKFALDQVQLVRGEAPEALTELPAATHAFIGGSGGNLKEILQALYEKNPTMRVVINAISLETISQIQNVLREFPIEEEETVQVQISRSREAGSYHLMQGENPVMITAFQFSCRKGDIDAKS